MNARPPKRGGPVLFYAATGDGVARVVVGARGAAEVEVGLENSGAQCVAVDPHDANRLYAGTFERGLYRSLDGGASWARVGDGIQHARVLSVALSPSQVERGRAVVYAGTEPSGLYRSEDDGATWRSLPALLEVASAPTWSFPPRPWTSHVRWIAPHHSDPLLLFVGIELGGVMRSRDGGETWEDRKPGSYHDSHVIATHPRDPRRVYEAAGEGVALSTDAGDTWRFADEGLRHRYVWGLAVDGIDPDLWYVSAAPGPAQAHGGRGHARAALYRKRGAGEWQIVMGAAHRLDRMPYALLTLPDHPGAVVAGFDDGRIHVSHDRGESWRELEATLPGIVALAA
jgi:hypothetical protein